MASLIGSFNNIITSGLAEKCRFLDPAVKKAHKSIASAKKAVVLRMSARFQLPVVESVVLNA